MLVILSPASSLLRLNYQSQQIETMEDLFVANFIDFNLLNIIRLFVLVNQLKNGWNLM